MTEPEFVYFLLPPWWRAPFERHSYRRHLLRWRLVRRRIGADTAEHFADYWSYERAIAHIRVIQRLRALARWEEASRD